MPYPLFFAHANGFPSRSYAYFLKHLHGSSLDFINCVGHGAYSPKKGWKDLVREITDHLEAQDSLPVVAIGHSLGGVLCFLAARERPDLFQALIMLDPPIFRPQLRAFLGLARLTGLIGHVAPASKARKRRTHFQSREEAREYFAGKALFKNFHPRCLDDYIQYGLQSDPNRNAFELSFSSKVEYEIFSHVPFRLGPKKLQVPSYFVHSNSEEVLGRKDLTWLKKAFSGTRFLPMAGGHMFPLERPEETAVLLNTLISSL